MPIDKHIRLSEKLKYFLIKILLIFTALTLVLHFFLYKKKKNPDYNKISVRTLLVLVFFSGFLFCLLLLVLCGKLKPF